MNEVFQADGGSEREATVGSLLVYPIKGAGAVSVSEAEVEPRGLAGDRRWMVVDEEGMFLSQRTHPRLALVRVTPNPGGWRLRAVGHGEILAPASIDGGARTTVTVWGDRVQALEGSEELCGWFSDLLESRCRLVFMPDRARREVYARCVPGHQVSFADAFPILLVGQASLEDLNRRLEEPVPMGRFRPNLVVDGCAPYAEDGWAAIETDAVSLAVVKPCGRCVVTTVDQATGLRGREPLVTLASYRLVGDEVMFGQNAVPTRTGTIVRGERIRIVTKAGRDC